MIYANEGILFSHWRWCSQRVSCVVRDNKIPKVTSEKK